MRLVQLPQLFINQIVDSVITYETSYPLQPSPSETDLPPVNVGRVIAPNGIGPHNKRPAYRQRSPALREFQEFSMCWRKTINLLAAGSSHLPKVADGKHPPKQQIVIV